MSDFEERVHGVMAGFVWGDICGWATQGWSPQEVQDFFGVFREPPAEWPAKVRALPPKLRRRLLPPGTHCASTQQGFSIANVLTDPAGWRLPLWIEWMVGALDQDALRGYDRVFLAAIHRLRSGMAVGSTPSGLGIDAVARCVPIAIRHAQQDPQAPTAVAEASLATHGELSTAVMSMGLVELLSHGLTNNGEVPDLGQFIAKVKHWERTWLMGDLPWTVQRGSAEDVSSQLEVFQSQGRGQGQSANEVLLALGNHESEKEGFPGLNGITAVTTFLHSVLSALYDEGEPQEILGAIVGQGGDAGAAGAIAGALLGARFGVGWIPVERLANADRVEAYATALRDGHPAEDFPGFIEQERSLTRAALTQREDLLAERRTGIRGRSPEG